MRLEAMIKPMVSIQQLSCRKVIYVARSEALNVERKAKIPKPIPSN